MKLSVDFHSQAAVVRLAFYPHRQSLLILNMYLCLEHYFSVANCLMIFHFCSPLIFIVIINYTILRERKSPANSSSQDFMMYIQVLITWLSTVVRKISVIDSKKRDFLLHDKTIISILITARPVINLSKNIEKQPFFVSKTGCLWVFIDYFLRSCRILACIAECETRSYNH